MQIYKTNKNDIMILIFFPNLKEKAMDKNKIVLLLVSNYKGIDSFYFLN